jgi:hypothetical protein
MFDAAGLQRLLALHEKSCGLFLWLNVSLKSGARSLSTVTKALAFSEAAELWIRDNHSNVPARFRPEAGGGEEFAHLFVSYLATSFEVVDRSMVKACPGCWCCVYWIVSRHLRRRDPDGKARRVAHQLILCLRKLGEELELPMSDAELEQFITDHRGLRPELALAS